MVNNIFLHNLLTELFFELMALLGSFFHSLNTSEQMDGHYFEFQMLENLEDIPQKFGYGILKSFCLLVLLVQIKSKNFLL